MLAKLAQLSFADWRGLGVAYLHLLAAGWRMFVLKDKLERWVVEGAVLSNQDNSTDDPGANVSEAEQASETRRGRWVNLAANRPFPWARCLQRSLALCLWMERKGYQPQLRIGVRKEGKELKAHAWVEFGGQVINDDPKRLLDFASLEAAKTVQTLLPK